MRKLPIQFYDRNNVVSIASELIRKIGVTGFGKKITSGRIVETEAYIGLTNRASRAFAAKRTNHNEHMVAKRAQPVFIFVMGNIIYLK